jgi:hypothetical protein
MSLTRYLLFCVIAALIAGCGGDSGDPTTFEGLIAAANDARLTSLRLAAVDTSCSVNSDCTELRFAGICPGNDSAPLSLRSATANEALAALQEQQRLMAAASKLDLRPPPPCAPPTPVAPACVQSQCKLVLPQLRGQLQDVRISAALVI